MLRSAADGGMEAGQLYIGRRHDPMVVVRESRDSYAGHDMEGRRIGVGLIGELPRIAASTLHTPFNKPAVTIIRSPTVVAIQTVAGSDR
jgi:hypothetical protein